jgi:hypothetical protein
MQKWWNLASNFSPFGQNDIHLHACMLIEEKPTQQISNKKSHACVPHPSRYFHMVEAMHDWLTQKKRETCNIICFVATLSFNMRQWGCLSRRCQKFNNIQAPRMPQPLSCSTSHSASRCFQMCLFTLLPTSGQFTTGILTMSLR